MADKREEAIDAINKKFIYVEFEAQNKPDFKPVRNGDYIQYGNDNFYPNYIIDLYQRCAENNAIINAKTNFVFGKGLSYHKTNDVSVDGKLEKFIKFANQFESWNKLLPKAILNFELIDGFYIQFIYGKNGKIVSAYNMDMTRIRRSNDCNGYWYCEDWNNRQKVQEKKYYPEYNDTIKTGSCIYYCKVEKPAINRYGDTYSIPSYTGALNAIQTDINIDIFFEALTANGMTAQGMLTLPNGEPANDEEAIEIERRFRKKHTGARNAGGIMLNFIDQGGTTATFQNFATSDLDKQFEILSKRNLQKITSGHRIDPVLIGIDTATSWDRPQLINKWERFNTEYVRIRQEKIMEAIKVMGISQGVAVDQLYFEALPPLGKEIQLSETTIDEVLTVQEKRQLLKKEYDVELTSLDDESTTSRLSIAQKLGVGGMASCQTLLLDTSKTPEEKLPILVNLYGIPKKKAQDMLGIIPALDVAMSAQGTILDRFKSLAQDVNDDEIVDEFYVNGAVGNEYFDEVLGGTIKQVRNQILDLIAGDPYIKPEIIAKQLGTDTEYVSEQITQLKEQGLLDKDGMTVKGMNRADNVEPVVETEIYTVYQYALSPKSDYSNSKGYIDTSHEFCVEMMKLANAGKVWTREDIDSITNDFDENAWVYRGGPTGRKGGGFTQYCNHVFKAIIKKRKRGDNA